MTIVPPESVSGGRLAGLQGAGNHSRDFARIHHLQRPHDSFRNRPYGRPILLCHPENEGMLEGCTTEHRCIFRVNYYSVIVEGQDRDAILFLDEFASFSEWS
jgi:hypothetical protein